MPSPDETSTYIIAGGGEGAARLRILGDATRPATRALLVRAGVAPGMRVLDLGCGSGEVTLELARMVGSSGRVTAVDGDAIVLAAGRERLRELSLDADFVHGDARGPYPSDGYDVVYARFLLSHLTDPAAVVAAMRAATRPGGTVIVEDVDFPGHFCHPPSAAFARFVELYQAVARRRGADPTIGPRLPHLLQDAGIADVELSVAQPAFLEGDGKRIAQITVQAIREAAVAAQLATQDEIDTIVAELDAHRRDPRTVQSIARIVQAWGTRPA
jgi:ubiquinone/menaquinone biosynthesis C-methylase UbiE